MSNSIAFIDSEDFDVQIDHVRWRITIAGELDFTTAPLMTEAASTLQSSIRDITIDLEDVTFIDASALGALIGVWVRQRASGTSLRVVANARVTRTAGLCDLDFLITELV